MMSAEAAYHRLNGYDVTAEKFNKMQFEDIIAFVAFPSSVIVQPLFLSAIAGKSLNIWLRTGTYQG